nr:MFS transporter [Opitutaceae bacterium]
YPTVFLWTLLPGLVAVGCLVFLVKERVRTAVPHVSFREGLRQLPPRYRRFLVAVGIFGAGSAAVGLYVAHNVFYAGFAFVAGWLADRVNKARLLAAGYALAAVMAVGVIVLPLGLWTLAAVFVAGGIYVAIEETLEDALCAELVPAELHGMAFGVLATVNGVGDFLSSVIVGALWSACGVATAFGYSAVLFAAGSFLVLRMSNSLISKG